MSSIFVTIFFSKEVKNSDNANNEEKNILVLDLNRVQWTSHYKNFYNRHEDWNWEEIPSFYFDKIAEISLEELLELIGRSKVEAIDKNIFLARNIKSVEDMKQVKCGNTYNVNSFYDELESENSIDKITVEIFGD